MSKVKLTDEQKGYYQRVEGILESYDDLQEDSDVFFGNFLDQMRSDSLERVFCDFIASRVAEKVFQMCDIKSDVAVALVQEVRECFPALCTSRCGSHVLETLLVQIYSGRELQDGDPLVEGMLCLAELALEDIKEKIKDPRASHVIRCILQLLGGIQVVEQILRSTVSMQYRSKKAIDVASNGKLQQEGLIKEKWNVPDTFAEMLQKFVKKFCKKKHILKVLLQENASPVYQTALIVTAERVPSACEQLCRKIVGCFGDKSDCSLPVLFSDPIGSHVVEVLFQIQVSGMGKEIYQQFVKGSINQMAVHPIANYILQQLIVHSNGEQIADILKEISFGEVLSSGQYGVLVKLAEVCTREADNQALFMKSLSSNFPSGTKDLLRSLLSLQTVTQEKEELVIELQGALLVQCLVQFEAVVSSLVDSLLKMEHPHHLQLACHVNGSHVIESFMKSKTLSAAQKGSIIQKYKPNLTALSKDKYGSRVVDSLWSNSAVSDKKDIAEELVKHEDEIKMDYYGKFVLRNCQIDFYKRKQLVWQSKQQSKKKKLDLFEDILEDNPLVDGGPLKVGKKRKSTYLESDSKSKKSKHKAKLKTV